MISQEQCKWDKKVVDTSTIFLTFLPFDISLGYRVGKRRSKDVSMFSCRGRQRLQSCSIACIHAVCGTPLCRE